MNTLKFTFIFLLVSFTPFIYADGVVLSDSEIRKIMIQESVSRYSGSCPCPYYRARNGSRCGKRSAWSRPGGYSPLCYEKDISEKMVNKYRSRMVK
jgi:hypothetical protein